MPISFLITYDNSIAHMIFHYFMLISFHSYQYKYHCFCSDKLRIHFLLKYYYRRMCSMISTIPDWKYLPFNVKWILWNDRSYVIQIYDINTNIFFIQSVPTLANLVSIIVSRLILWQEVVRRIGNQLKAFQLPIKFTVKCEKK